MEMMISNAQKLTLSIGAAMIGIGASLVVAGIAFDWIWHKLHKSQSDDQTKR